MAQFRIQLVASAGAPANEVAEGLRHYLFVALSEGNGANAVREIELSEGTGTDTRIIFRTTGGTMAHSVNREGSVVIINYGDSTLDSDMDIMPIVTGRITRINTQPIAGGTVTMHSGTDTVTRPNSNTDTATYAQHRSVEVPRANSPVTTLRDSDGNTQFAWYSDTERRWIISGVDAGSNPWIYQTDSDAMAGDSGTPAEVPLGGWSDRPMAGSGATGGTPIPTADVDPADALIYANWDLNLDTGVLTINDVTGGATMFNPTELEVFDQAATTGQSPIRLAGTPTVSATTITVALNDASLDALKTRTPAPASGNLFLTYDGLDNTGEGGMATGVRTFTADTTAPTLMNWSLDVSGTDAVATLNYSEPVRAAATNGMVSIMIAGMTLTATPMVSGRTLTVTGAGEAATILGTRTDDSDFTLSYSATQIEDFADNAAAAASSVVPAMVTYPTPVFSSSATRNVRAGGTFTLTATGGTITYAEVTDPDNVFTVAAGGTVTVSSTAAAGAHTLVVRATNQYGNSAEQTITNTVPATVLTFSPAAPATIGPFEVGVPVDVQLPAAVASDGSTPTITYDVDITTLPRDTGLEFNATTRRITGTPLVARANQTLTYTATATGYTSASAMIGYSLTPSTNNRPMFNIPAGTLSFSTRQILNGFPITVGGNIVTVLDSDSSDMISVSVSPALPGGLTVDRDTNTGAIRLNTSNLGINATAARADYVITARDQRGDSDTFTLTLTIEAQSAPTFRGGGVISDSVFMVGDTANIVLPYAIDANTFHTVTYKLLDSEVTTVAAFNDATPVTTIAGAAITLPTGTTDGSIMGTVTQLPRTTYYFVASDGVDLATLRFTVTVNAVGQLTSWSFDGTAGMNGQMTLNFSVPFDAATFDPTRFVLQSLSDSSGVNYTLTTGSQTASPAGTSIVVNISAADATALRSRTSLLQDSDSAFLALNAAMGVNTGTDGTDIEAIPTSNALQASTVVPYANRAPMFAGTGVGLQITERTALTYTLANGAAVDPEGDAITYSITTPSGAPMATNPPTIVNDSDLRVLFAAPTNAQVGMTYMYTVTATSTGGSDTLILTADVVANSQPTFGTSSIMALSGTVGDMVDISLPFATDSDGHGLTYRLIQAATAPTTVAAFNAATPVTEIAGATVTLPVSPTDGTSRTTGTVGHIRGTLDSELAMTTYHLVASDGIGVSSLPLTAVVAAGDTTGPSLGSWTFDGSTGNGQITLNFSETVIASSVTPTAITLQGAAISPSGIAFDEIGYLNTSGTFVSAAMVSGTITGIAIPGSMGPPHLTFSTAAEATAVSNAYVALGNSVSYTGIRMRSGGSTVFNAPITGTATGQISDGAFTGPDTLVFDPASQGATGFGTPTPATVPSGMTAPMYTLTADATVANTSDSDAITLAIGSTDRAAIQGISGLLDSETTAFLSATSSLAEDAAGNSFQAITAAMPRQATAFTAYPPVDTAGPILDSWSFDGTMGTNGRLTLDFNEVVDASTLMPTAITVANASSLVSEPAQDVTAAGGPGGYVLGGASAVEALFTAVTGRPFSDFPASFADGVPLLPGVSIVVDGTDITALPANQRATSISTTPFPNAAGISFGTGGTGNFVAGVYPNMSGQSITISYSAGASASHTLTGGTVSTTDSEVITIDLVAADRQAIVDSDILRDITSTLAATAGYVMDTASTPNAAPEHTATRGMVTPYPSLMLTGYSDIDVPANTAITSQTPMVTLSSGTVPTTLAYTIDPALPPGLTLNASTGVLSGTPDSEYASVAHTVTVSDPANNFYPGTQTFNVEVDAAAMIRSRSLRVDTGVLSRNQVAGNTRMWTVSAWVKRNALGTALIMSTPGTSSAYSFIGFNANDEIWANVGTNSFEQVSGTRYRDTNAWYHVVWSADSTARQSIIYVNGVEVGRDTGSDGFIAGGEGYFGRAGVRMDVGGFNGNNAFNGYIAELYYVDGTILDPTDFAETVNGKYQPKAYTGALGANGHYLNFADRSALGNSSNANNFTTVTTVGASADHPDHNYATMNSLVSYSAAHRLGGNLTSNSTGLSTPSGIALPNSGQWYFEARMNVASATGQNLGLVITPNPTVTGLDNAYGLNAGASTLASVTNGTSAPISGASVFSAGDIVAIAADMDARTVTTYVNGTQVGSVLNLAAGQEDFFARMQVASTSAPTGGKGTFNFGQDATFGGRRTAAPAVDSDALGQFAFAPPAGFMPLRASSLPVGQSGGSDIIPDQHFEVYQYANATAPSAVTAYDGLGFQPDLLMFRNTNFGAANAVFDSVRGTGHYLQTDMTAGNVATDRFASFDSDGFSLDGSGTTGGTGWGLNDQAYTVYAWRAGDSETTAASTGNIQNLMLNANPDAGFSIATFSTSAMGSGTFNHGLGAPAELMIHKRTDSAAAWDVYWFGEQLYGNLDSSAAPVSHTATTSDGTNITGFAPAANSSSVAYMWRSIPGYSKIGSYTGNFSTNGPFVYTGFEPEFVLVKSTTGNEPWQVMDAKTNAVNPADNGVQLNNQNAFADINGSIDLLSNGFKIRTNIGNYNRAGEYVYMAFARDPLKTSTAARVDHSDPTVANQPMNLMFTDSDMVDRSYTLLNAPAANTITLTGNTLVLAGPDADRIGRIMNGATFAYNSVNGEGDAIRIGQAAGAGQGANWNISTAAATVTINYDSAANEITFRNGNTVLGLARGSSAASVTLSDGGNDFISIRGNGDLDFNLVTGEATTPGTSTAPNAGTPALVTTGPIFAHPDSEQSLHFTADVADIIAAETRTYSAEGPVRAGTSNPGRITVAGTSAQADAIALWTQLTGTPVPTGIDTAIRPVIAGATITFGGTAVTGVTHVTAAGDNGSIFGNEMELLTSASASDQVALPTFGRGAQPLVVSTQAITETGLTASISGDVLTISGTLADNLPASSVVASVSADDGHGGFASARWVLNEPAAPAGIVFTPSNSGTGDISQFASIGPTFFAISFNVRGAVTGDATAGDEWTAFIAERIADGTITAANPLTVEVLDGATVVLSAVITGVTGPSNLGNGLTVINGASTTSGAISRTNFTAIRIS